MIGQIGMEMIHTVLQYYLLDMYLTVLFTGRGEEPFSGWQQMKVSIVQKMLNLILAR